MSTADKIELPDDGQVTRAAFEALPAPTGRWAWQLRSGRLEMTHVTMTGWHWLTVVATLEHWRRLGYATAGDQYVADSAFLGAGARGTNLVARGVVFEAGHRPDAGADIHAVAHIHAIIEAASADDEERDAAQNRSVYAQSGIQCYWIIRRESAEAKKDGLISMYELADGEYRLVGHRLVSQLKGSAE